MALTARDKQLTLVAAVLGSAVALLDTTVTNVALPAIREDLGGGLQGQQWVVNAYLLLLGSLILVGGSLADLFGERRVFTIGVGGFGLASLACAAAPSIEALVAARAVQGAFAALLTPASLAVIVAVFSEAERGRAIGTWTAYTGMGAVLGPFLGGLLVDGLNWRWVFAINVPLVLLTLAVATRMPPAHGMPEGRRPDVLGAVLCAAGLAGPVFALIRQPDVGWGDPQVLVPLVAGLAVFGAFLAWERRTRDPMLPIGLFARGNFAWGNVETLAVYGGLGVLFFVLVVFLQQIGGYSATAAGLAILPTPVVMFVLARRWGALADRHGPRLFMGAGPLVAAAGVVLVVALADADPAYATEVLPGMGLFALGLSMTVAPLTAAVLADVAAHNAGIASGVNNAVARVAGLLATASIGAVVGGALDLGGFRAGMLFAAGLLAVGGIVGTVRIRNAPRREVHCADCPGGQLAGAPPDAVRPPAAAAAGAAAAASASAQ